MVRKALYALPAEMRQVIIMKEYEELTFAEIAEILRIPVSTVKSRLYTGLQQMGARLEKMRGLLRGRDYEQRKEWIRFSERLRTQGRFGDLSLRRSECD